MVPARCRDRAGSAVRCTVRSPEPIPRCSCDPARREGRQGRPVQRLAPIASCSGPRCAGHGRSSGPTPRPAPPARHHHRPPWPAPRVRAGTARTPQPWCATLRRPTGSASSGTASGCRRRSTGEAGRRPPDRGDRGARFRCCRADARSSAPSAGSHAWRPAPCGPRDPARSSGTPLCSQAGQRRRSSAAGRGQRR